MPPGTQAKTRKRKKKESEWKRHENAAFPRLNHGNRKKKDTVHPIESFLCNCPNPVHCINLIGGVRHAKSIQDDFHRLRKSATFKSPRQTVNMMENERLARFLHFVPHGGVRRKYTYSLPAIGGSVLRVCQQAFMVTFGITEKRLTTVRNSKTGKIEPRMNMTGKQSSINKVPKEFMNAVYSHSEGFPARESHYSREKSVNLRYLDSALNAKLMWKLYTAEFPEFPVSYDCY